MKIYLVYNKDQKKFIGKEYGYISLDSNHSPKIWVKKYTAENEIWGMCDGRIKKHRNSISRCGFPCPLCAVPIYYYHSSSDGNVKCHNCKHLMPLWVPESAFKAELDAKMALFNKWQIIEIDLDQQIQNQIGVQP